MTDDQATDEQQQDEKRGQPEDEKRDQPEDEQGSGGDGGKDDDDDEVAKARKAAEEEEKAKEKVKELEDDPPAKLEDWPDDKAKYETFGGPEGEHSYEDGPEAQLGPSSLRHHEDGKVTIEGEEVDDPDEYKGEPIPGGPTDPDAKQMYGEPDLSDENEGDSDEEGDGDKPKAEGEDESKDDSEKDAG